LHQNQPQKRAGEARGQVRRAGRGDEAAGLGLGPIGAELTMSADDFFAAAERVLLEVIDAGETPASWRLTSSLYIHLEEGQDWRIHARRVEQLAAEEPRPLYGLAVYVEPGAHHAWDLRTSEGQKWDERGRVVYSVKG
jgi:hypothetical protein